MALVFKKLYLKISLTTVFLNVLKRLGEDNGLQKYS